MGVTGDVPQLRAGGSLVREYLRAMPLPFTSTAGAIVAHQFGWTGRAGLAQGAQGDGYVQSSLVLWSVAACGGDPGDALPVAAAVELLHRFALLHEELQDGARIEADPESTVARWGVAQGLNGGDALCALAYETLTVASVHPDRVLAVGRIISHALLEAISVRRPDPRRAYGANTALRGCLSDAFGRSGALLGASLEAGAVMAGATAAVVRNLRRAGRFLGVAVEMHAVGGNDVVRQAFAERFAAKAIDAAERCALDRTNLEAFKEMAHHAVTEEDETSSRKAEHLLINIDRDVAAKGIDAGFDAYRFVHNALPEIDLAAVDPSVEIFGRKLSAPLLISCMTGGTRKARRINSRLARVAREHGLAMGLGSGRALLERPELLASFDVRSDAPDILLFANLGAVQLNKGYGVDDCRRLVEMLSADALVLHLNALQEALQPGGDTCFGGVLSRIAALCREIEVPVVVKEVGWGIAPDAVRALFDAGVAAVDVAGAGGTSWSEVERYRSLEPWRGRVAASFADWGISTAECVRAARAAAPDKILFASGGIRSGLDAVKAIALGADLVGIAGPFLRAADAGLDEANELAREYVEVIRVAMFALGVRSLGELRYTPLLHHAGDAPLGR